MDLHVPCLLVFPPGTELHQHPLYRGGQLILQDKVRARDKTLEQRARRSENETG